MNEQTIITLVRELDTVKKEITTARSRIEELERILRKIVKSEFPHAIWCNYQHPSCKSCNCGMADARQALSCKSEPVEPKEVSVKELSEFLRKKLITWGYGDDDVQRRFTAANEMSCQLLTKYTIKEKV